MNEIRDPNWMTHLWQRVKSLFSGLDARVTALEQGGGGGGGAVSGVKGDAESTYRTGAVNLTAANIGAKAVQAAVSDPVASGTAVEFIAGISQDTQGVITPAKKSVPAATQSSDGLLSAADKTKLDGVAAGAQVNTITGVKGNAESSYRTGDVNLTPANIGAVAKSGDTMTGTLLLTMVPFTDANDAEADLFSLRRYNSSTLNTPYSAGLTTANLGVIASYGGANNMTQLCVPQGKNTMFVRLKSSGTWGDWQLLTQPERRITYTSTISVTGATIGSRVSNQVFYLPTGVTVNDVKGVYVSKVTDSSAAHVTPMFGSAGQLIVAVYAAKATVNADVEVTVVY